MNKSGSGVRATFVSPYLRRPLRTLEKVIGDREIAERAYEADESAAEDVGPAPEAWGPARKRLGEPD